MKRPSTTGIAITLSFFISCCWFPLISNGQLVRSVPTKQYKYEVIQPSAAAAVASLVTKVLNHFAEEGKRKCYAKAMEELQEAIVKEQKKLKRPMKYSAIFDVPGCKFIGMHPSKQVLRKTEGQCSIDDEFIKGTDVLLDPERHQIAIITITPELTPEPEGVYLTECIEVVKKERGKNCGKPQSMEVFFKNNCGKEAFVSVHYERAKPTSSGKVWSGYASDIKVGQVYGLGLVCEGTGRFIYQARASGDHNTKFARPGSEEWELFVKENLK